MKKEYSELVDDFHAGDLLFGLEKEAREGYYGDVFHRMQASEPKYSFITIDDINQQLAPLFIEKQYKMSPLRECETPVKKHAAFLLTQDAFHPRSPEGLPGSEQKLRYKQLRSCLAAIEDCPGKIRFCLDGLDLNKARNADFYKEYNSYTSNELRYIAHNYEKLANKVVFYLGGTRVDAPWEQEGLSPDVWLSSYSYQPKLVSPSQFKYSTPTKRSRADMIRGLFFPYPAQDPQATTKCPKFEDENSSIINLT